MNNVYLDQVWQLAESTDTSDPSVGSAVKYSSSVNPTDLASLKRFVSSSGSLPTRNKFEKSTIDPSVLLWQHLREDAQSIAQWHVNHGCADVRTYRRIMRARMLQHVRVLMILGWGVCEQVKESPSCAI